MQKLNRIWRGPSIPVREQMNIKLALRFIRQFSPFQLYSEPIKAMEDKHGEEYWKLSGKERSRAER